MTWFLILLVALVIPRMALGGHEFPIVVAQPVWSEEGLYLAPVTYVKTIGAFHLDYAIHLSCSPNMMPDRSGEPMNRNLASLSGLSIDLDLTEDQMRDEWWHDNDTLAVILNVAELGGVETVRGVRSERIVEVTFECILMNAAQSRPYVNYVELGIVGSDKHGYMEGVYPLQDVAACSATRVPYDLMGGRFGEHWKELQE